MAGQLNSEQKVAYDSESVPQGNPFIGSLAYRVDVLINSDTVDLPGVVYSAALQASFFDTSVTGSDRQSVRVRQWWRGRRRPA